MISKAREPKGQKAVNCQVKMKVFMTPFGYDLD